MDKAENNLDKTPKKVDNVILTPKNIAAFSTFAASLKQIHIRLIAEGYIIRDGKIAKSERLLSYENDNKPDKTNQ